MPAIDREAVRLLAIEIGVRPAARKLGLDEDRVRQWSCRGQWFAQPHDATGASVTSVTRPGDVLLAELQTLERETRMSLAKSAAGMAREAEKAPLRAAGNVHKAAQVAAVVHRWDANDKQGNTFTLNVLNLSMFDAPPDDAPAS